MSVRTFKEAEEVLAASLPGYESRIQQATFAESVEDAIRGSNHLLAEAGTGTGKSIGYLIPSILSGKRVVISTATKALQTQVWTKDIPFLQEHLKDFTAALLKGRSNYICVNKLAAADPADVPHLRELMDLVSFMPEDAPAIVDEFPLNPEFSGERDDLPFDVEHWEWARISAEADDCKTLGCKDNGKCFAQRARRMALDAQVVIVNHALYLTDLYVREVSGGNATMLGDHHVVVFDEAHELEEYAGSVLGSTFRETGIRTLCAEVRNLAQRHLPGFEREAEQMTAEVITALDVLWSVLEEGRIRQANLIEHADEFVNFANALVSLREWIASPAILEEVPSEQLTRVKRKRERTMNHIISASLRFSKLVTESFTDLVRWVEIERGKKVLKSAPVDVAPYLREWLFGRGGVTAILVSATLSVNGRFDYIAGRLGVDDYDSLDVGTPFDYEHQAGTYVPAHLPDPTREKAAWSAMAMEEMLDLIRISDGRALLLFTSLSEMRNAYELIAPRVDHRCMMQGEAPNKVLARDFAEDENSILFATRSFMTGVDFQGDTLKLVVINKLPFPVPTEPLTEARCEAIKARGGSDFMEYTIPVMTLILKQAYGRLIRHRNDSGVVAILDPRLQTKGYGRIILDSLPPAPLLAQMSEVEDRIGVTV